LVYRLAPWASILRGTLFCPEGRDRGGLGQVARGPRHVGGGMAMPRKENVRPHVYVDELVKKVAEALAAESGQFIAEIATTVLLCDVKYVGDGFFETNED